MKTLQLVLIVTAGAAAALAQTPTIAAGGIVNAASYTGPPLPNSPIAQGSLFVVFGANLGPAALQQAGAYPLSVALGGTSVDITVSGTTMSAIMVYASAGQLAAILPSSTPAGAGTVTVTYNGRTSNPAPIQIVPGNFGIFSLNQAGSGPGIVTGADYKVVTFTSPAKPGDTDIIWGTGLGPVAGDEAAGPLPGDLTAVPVQVYVGQQPAAISYRGRSGCCAGLDQIAFVVPAGVEGCYVPIVVRINNFVSNTATMAISSSGGACSDPIGFSSPALQQLSGRDTLNLGSIVLSRLSSVNNSITPGSPPTTTTTDTAFASFSRYLGSQLNAFSGFGYSSLGTCIVSSFTNSATVNPLRPKGLDAGPLIMVTGPNGTRNLTASAQVPGFYSGNLGGGSGAQAMPPYLDPGAYRFSNGSGGADIGAFLNATLTVATALTWTNSGDISTILRTQPLTIAWSGGDPAGFVQITGGSLMTSADSPASASGTFVCTAPVSAGSFIVPAFVLLNLPPSSVLGSGPFAFSTASLSVGSSTKPVSFTAPGLDYGTVIANTSTQKSVTYQ